ncbi:MAG: hypothetical protein L3J09_05155 [Flavobacteriaceae bacterium]|nr:hypothetical protein [Flavobacteriaceae bacterium]
MNFLHLIFPLLFITSCNSSDNPVINTDNEVIPITEQAEIVCVLVSGSENDYSFSVGILSSDTGCEQYTNWWEVISEDGTELIYRKILSHSHVNEQPFVRSGGLVEITDNQSVIIRAHINTSSYGIKVFKGTVASGFTAFTLSEGFATNLETQDPLATSCAF